MGATGLTWQRGGPGLRRILVHRHRAPACASGEELPRRSELARHTNGDRGSALGARSAQTPPGPNQPPHLPLRLPRLAEQRPARQCQHSVGTDAVEGPAAGRAAFARLHPASCLPPPGADCSEAAARAGAAIHTVHSLPRLQAPKPARGWSRRVAQEEPRGCGGGAERRRGRGRTAAREGRLAPERQRWRLQPGTICARAEALNPTWQPRFPREPPARGPGPPAPFRLALAPPPPGRARRREGEGGVGERQSPSPWALSSRLRTAGTAKFTILISFSSHSSHKAHEINME